jgi:hypothetical protein
MESEKYKAQSLNTFQSLNRLNSLPEIKEEDPSEVLDNKAQKFLPYNNRKINTHLSDIPIPLETRERIKNTNSITDSEYEKIEKNRGQSRKLLSFYNGKPRTTEAIERMTDPFYTCDKIVNTVQPSSPDKKGNNYGNEIELINTLELKTFKSMFMTILQIINSIIRYTLVQFPYCIRVLGLVYGPIIISIIGIMSIYSVYMLIEIKNYTNKK